MSVGLVAEKIDEQPHKPPLTPQPRSLTNEHCSARGSLEATDTGCYFALYPASSAGLPDVKFHLPGPIRGEAASKVLEAEARLCGIFRVFRKLSLHLMHLCVWPRLPHVFLTTRNSRLLNKLKQTETFR